MSNSRFVVGCIIPLMSDLNMSWHEIKNTPRFELEGLAQALSEFNILHSVRHQWSDYLAKRRKFGMVKASKSFSEAGLI